MYRNDRGTFADVAAQVGIVDFSEVRVYAAGTSRLLGTRLVDTGSGYCSQNAAPVHVGLPDEPSVRSVDVEITVLAGGRRAMRLPNVRPSGVPVVVRVNAASVSSK